MYTCVQSIYAREERMLKEAIYCFAGMVGNRDFKVSIGVECCERDHCSAFAGGWLYSSR